MRRESKKRGQERCEEKTRKEEEKRSKENRKEEKGREERRKQNRREEKRREERRGEKRSGGRGGSSMALAEVCSVSRLCQRWDYSMPYTSLENTRIHSQPEKISHTQRREWKEKRVSDQEDKGEWMRKEAREKRESERGRRETKKE